MIYDEQLLKVDEKVDQLLTAIRTSQSFQNYQQAKSALDQDPAVGVARKAFEAAKEDFERIAAYGNYASGYRDKQIAVFQKKRALDLLATVSVFRQAETDLQDLLDQIGGSIAHSISESVKVDAGNPFFVEDNDGCRGNCHASR